MIWSNKHRALRRLPFAFFTALLLSLLLYVFRFQILVGMASFLIVNDTLIPADIIFVLNGDVDMRPFHAAKLYNEGLAPKILIAKEENTPAVEIGLYPNGTDVAVGVMKKLGVSDSDIVVLRVPNGVTSTLDEARALRRYMQDHDVRSVIIVTTAFHGRRTKWIFSRELRGLPVEIRIATAAHWNFDESNWWTNEQGLLTCINEYLKLLHYLFFKNL